MRLALLAILVATGCAPAAPTPPPDPEPEPAAPTLPWSGTTAQFADELATLDAQVASLDALAASQPGWTHLQAAAGLHLQRARLSGDWDDYDAAQAQIDVASARAKAPAGPHAVRIALNYSLHRFGSIAADIARLEGRMPRSDAHRSQEAVLRGSLAMSQGDYAAAERELEQAFAIRATPNGLSTLAVLRWQLGDYDTAEGLFIEAGRRYHGVSQEPRAWFHLHLGLMDLDRGLHEDALAHYRDAERELAGSWLVDEHIAEVLTNLGQIDAARALYLDVIERTDGAPEFLDALAGLEADAGNTDRATSLRARALVRWEELLARYPEAAAGHALGHFLETGQHERALAIATSNAAVRPDGEAGTLLAEALLGAGQIEAAQARIDAVIASPYDHPDVHALAARIAQAR